jgi:urease accessory protein
MALVGAFAFFHGHAHGAEGPTGGSLLLYGIGFVAATVLLHGLGITAGLATRLVDETARPRILQACGAVIGLIGVGLTFALV